MNVKEKLLASATKVFAHSGYRDGKVADIVKGAKANIAAVNYYFGSKEKLFTQILRTSFAEAEKTHPIYANLPDSAPCEQRLAAFARAIILRTLDSGPAGNFNRIMSHTVLTSGSPIDTICTEITTLQITPLRPILEKFIGPADEITYAVASLNFITLSGIVSRHPFVINKIFGTNPAPLQLEHFIDQQVAAILDAMRSFTACQPYPNTNQQPLDSCVS